MHGISLEPGCVFDALAFLARYFEETHATPSGGQEGIFANPYYRDVLSNLNQKSVVIPHHLRPFFHKTGESGFYLYNIIFDRPYGGCSFEKLKRTLHNRAYLKRSLAEYHFPRAESGELQQLLSAEHPGAIDLLKHHPPDPALESYLLYIFLRFDQAAQELTDVFEAVYREISDAQQSFLSQSGDFEEALKNDSVLGKLRVISRSEDPGGLRLTFALSLMDRGRISFHPDEPTFFLLGYDFENRLEHEYKYCAVTPYSFALAIGNTTKYEIYKFLLGKPPLSSADIGRQLHVSRNALTYNLNEMLNCGLVVLDHIKGLTYYYKLDHEYLGVVSQQLALSAAIPG